MQIETRPRPQTQKNMSRTKSWLQSFDAPPGVRYFPAYAKTLASWECRPDGKRMLRISFCPFCSHSITCTNVRSRARAVRDHLKSCSGWHGPIPPPIYRRGRGKQHQSVSGALTCNDASELQVQLHDEAEQERADARERGELESRYSQDSSEEDGDEDWPREPPEWRRHELYTGPPRLKQLQLRAASTGTANGLRVLEVGRAGPLCDGRGVLAR